jgi:hypothetical protein
MNESSKSRRPVPWVGIILTLVIAVAILSFWVFKRGGSKPPLPPPPDETTGSVPGQPFTSSLV